MNKTMTLAPDLVLDRTAITKKFGWVGISGGGKTYGATKFAEGLYALGAQLVVVDVMGTWWGLRFAADGEKPGIPIYIFGGAHGDIPLEPTSGAVVADLIVDTRCSVILDVSEMTEEEQRRFVTDFARRLLFRKKRAKSPIHLIWEEMQDLCPETPESKLAAACVYAVAKLSKQGRNFGVGSSFITQRPQAVSKEVLNQVECLMAFSTSGPQEVDALKKWIKQKDRAAELDAAINALQPGECFLWSPAWLKRFGRIRIAKKWTFDSSKTPDFEADEEIDRRPSPLDMAEVSKAMAATIEKAKADDPVALRAELAAVRAERDRANKAVLVGDQHLIGTYRGEVAELKKQLAYANRRADDATKLNEEDRQAIAQLFRSLTALGQEFAGVADFMHRVEEAQTGLARDALAAVKKLDARSAVRPAANGHARPAAPPPAPRHSMAERPAFRAAPEVGGGGNADLPPGERATLTALIQYPQGLTRQQLRGLTGYKRSSSDSYIQRLKEKGLVTAAGDSIKATQEGVAALPNAAPLPTGADLQDWWTQRLPAGERRVLVELIAAYPEYVDKEVLRDATEYKRSSVDSYLQRLEMREIVVLGRGQARAADVLFQ